MMRILFTILIVSLTVQGLCGDTTLNIVPRPLSVKTLPGKFLLDKQTLITADNSLAFEAKFLSDKLHELYEWDLKTDLTTSGKKNRIALALSTKVDAAEGYKINISSEGILIQAKDNAGIFYGIQSLMQILPNRKLKLPLAIPALEINDRPAFAYRGMHLDVARHFFSVREVKKYLDHLAMMKLNKFHWHLSDDQGWRIEIKKYPLLTSVGACRDRTLMGRFGSKVYDSSRYCGFYTQEEIRSVIAYARDRHIEVIPEIDMPGHTLAALASYPFLGCSGGPYKVLDTWGSVDQTFCPGKESTYQFVFDVLDEIGKLFPSKYIHIGGDEVLKSAWENCVDCRTRMEKNNLAGFGQLEKYFISRVEKHLEAAGKTMIGWDEITDSRLSLHTIIMSWRGEKAGIVAAKLGYHVIMSPNSFAYFDYAQSLNEDSLTIGGYLPLEKVYDWNPKPAALNKEQGKLILGGQANLWTEYIGSWSKLQYMIFPRISALSESLWTADSLKSWKNFELRIPSLFDRFTFLGINFSSAYYDLQSSILDPASPGAVTWKLNSRSDQPIIIRDSTGKILAESPNEAMAQIRNSGKFTATLSGAGPGNKTTILSQPFSFNLATGKKITLVHSPNEKYSRGGAFSLVDGIAATKGMVESSRFLGFLGKDLDARIDLGAETKLSTVCINVLPQNISWIYMPSRISVQVYDKDNRLTAEAKREFSDAEELRKICFPVSAKGRYIRVFAENYGLIPAGKAGAGTKAWLFADEIEVY